MAAVIDRPHLPDRQAHHPPAMINSDECLPTMINSVEIRRFAALSDVLIIDSASGAELIIARLHNESGRAVEWTTGAAALGDGPQLTPMKVLDADHRPKKQPDPGRNRRFDQRQRPDQPTIGGLISVSARTSRQAAV